MLTWRLDRWLLLYSVAYIPMVLLAIVYVVHGIQAILQDQGLIDVVNVIPIFEPIVGPFLIFIGITDIIVAVAVVAIPNIYKVPFLLYATLWPIVPNGLRQIGDLNTEWGEAIIFGIIGIVSLLAFLLQRRIGHKVIFKITTRRAASQ